MRNRYAWLILLLICLNASIVTAQQARELVVFAAASLTDAFDQIGAAYEAENPDVAVLFNFGGSSTLAAQIVQGAPADVFASANNTQMQAAFDAGHIVEPVQTFARNRLVLIVPADNPAQIEILGDLANPGIRLILAAPEVPVRTYTDTMLARMAEHDNYGEAFRTAVLSNLVSEEPNVRQVSAKVALGEADAGVVYLSDVTPDIAENVITLTIPDAFNTIATYPIAATADSRQAELAADFIRFVLSSAGQQILEDWGFVPVEPADAINMPDDGYLRVAGELRNPLSLDFATLQADFSLQTVDISDTSDTQAVTRRYSGVLLWDLIKAAQPDFDITDKQEALKSFIIVTSINGDQVVLSWAEIDPEYSEQPVLIALTEDGNPLLDTPRLIVPTDRRDGRSLQNIVNISLYSAPAPAQD